MSFVGEQATDSRSSRCETRKRFGQGYLAGEGEEVLSLLRAREQNAEEGGHDTDEVMRQLEAIVSGTRAA